MLTRQGVLLTWKTLMGIVVGASVVALVFGGLAQKGAAQTSTLTPQDYIDIQQLVNRYPYAIDTGAGKGGAYADLFTADGAFTNESGRHAGRVELAKIGGSERPQETPNNVAHYLSNVVIEPLPGGGAKGKQYLQILGVGKAEAGATRNPPIVNRMGHYDDVYQKTPQGWRFKERVVTFDPRTYVQQAPAASR